MVATGKRRHNGAKCGTAMLLFGCVVSWISPTYAQPEPEPSRKSADGQATESGPTGEGAVPRGGATGTPEDGAAPERGARAPAPGAETAGEVAFDGRPVRTRDYVTVGIAGLAALGAGWVTTLVVAATTNSGNKKLAAGHAAVPVAGPFIMLAEGSHAADFEGVLASLGVLQGVGLAATFLGFTLESKVLIDPSGAYLAPIVTPTALGLTGAF